MTTYLVEAYAPAGLDLSEVEARAQAAATAMADEGVVVEYVRPIFVPGDETCFHLIEGRSEAGVIELIRRASLSFIRITETRP
ncbi:MAG TPA: hypothetical protein VJ930_10475 [Acidimicrobiia bacterium]|nr:hypothetical protein [Acidimicrobiia bacterium]